MESKRRFRSTTIAFLVNSPIALTALIFVVKGCGLWVIAKVKKSGEVLLRSLDPIVHTKEKNDLKWYITQIRYFLITYLNNTSHPRL